MRYAICYISIAVNPELEEIKNLLRNVKQWNKEKDIKGILLYADGNFFQVIEGKKPQIIKLYDKIEKDPRHKNIIQVLGKEISQGSFDGYDSEVITDNNRIDPEIVENYLQNIQGMEPGSREVVERMLEAFIETRK